MSIARTSAVDALCQAGVLVLSLAGGIALSRALGPEGQGAWVLAAVTASGLLQQVAHLGMGLAAQTWAARRPASRAELHGVAVLTAAMGGAVGLVLFAGLGDWSRRVLFPGAEPWQLLAAAAGVPFLLYQFCVASILNGAGRAARRARTELAMAAVQSAAIIALALALGSGGLGALVAAYYAVAAGGAVVFARVLASEGVGLARPRAALLWGMWRYGRWVYAADFASRSRSLLDQVLANGFGGAEALGVYHRAAALAGRGGFLGKALKAASWNRITTAAPREAAELAAAAFRQALLVGGAVSVVGIAAAPLIPLIYGSGFEASVGAFRVLLPAMALSGAARQLATYASGRLARPRIAAAIDWTTVAVQAAVTLALVGPAGALAAVVWGAAAAHGLTAVLYGAWFVGRRETPGLGALLLPRRGDLEAWRRLLPRRR